ncbi:MAG TPA: hypothetical protein VNL97_01115 [Solirubrobacterales bacterium]|jgi:hypothetical protein|nr:hypothetical protein [Solirubrobacterales bacterium]
MNQAEGVERRKERAVFETERHIIVGDVTLPPEGYQSRFSDLLNREGVDFIPLTNVVVTSIATGEETRRDFIAIGRAHIHCAYPARD